MLQTHGGHDNREIMLLYKDAAALCIELCKGQTPNSTLLYMMHKYAILESIVSGDACMSSTDPFLVGP